MKKIIYLIALSCAITVHISGSNDNKGPSIDNSEMKEFTQHLAQYFEAHKQELEKEEKAINATSLDELQKKYESVAEKLMESGKKITAGIADMNQKKKAGEPLHELGSAIIKEYAQQAMSLIMLRHIQSAIESKASEPEIKNFEYETKNMGLKELLHEKTRFERKFDSLDKQSQNYEKNLPLSKPDANLQAYIEDLRIRIARRIAGSKVMILEKIIQEKQATQATLKNAGSAAAPAKQ